MICFRKATKKTNGRGTGTGSGGTRNGNGGMDRLDNEAAFLKGNSTILQLLLAYWHFPPVLTLFMSFLNNMKQCVVVDGVKFPFIYIKQVYHKGPG